MTKMRSRREIGPRISLNKLAEYLEAGPRRRRSIVKAQKEPPGEMIVARYGDALRALKDYFSTRDASALARRIEELRSDRSGTKWARQDRLLSADALVAASDLLEGLEIDGIEFLPFPSSSNAHLEIAGTSVSVRPDFLLVSRGAAEAVTGAVKFSFNKTNALSDEGCAYVATLLREYLSRTYPESRIANDRCFAVSVAKKVVVTAPRAVRSRLESVEAACEEIAGRWAAA